MGCVPADAAGVRLNRTEIKAAPIKYPAIGPVHGLICLIQGLIVNIKAVGILHDKLTASHEAEPRAYFIPELRLYLIEV